MGRQQWLREAEKQMVARDDCGIRVLFFKKKKQKTNNNANAYSSINKWRVAILEKGECASEILDWGREG